MLQFRQLDHVVLRVTNLQAMMHFYTDVLGCSVEKVQEKIGLWQLRAGSSLSERAGAVDLRARSRRQHGGAEGPAMGKLNARQPG